jgi:hypothetical protein
MNDFVSSRRFSVLVLVTSLSVVWVACSMFIAYGLPWMGLGWVGLALSAALWVSIRSTRPIAQVSGAESSPLIEGDRR